MEEITNFREIRMGRMSMGILYRSSHPLNPGILGDTIEKQAVKAQINSVLNLCDIENDEIQRLIKTRTWYENLFNTGNIIFLGMDFDLAEKDFNDKLKKGIEFIVTNTGPYLIHCFGGLDRTGFVSAILEALMGAKLEDIYADYEASFNKGFVSYFKHGDFDNNYILLERYLIKMNKGGKINNRNIQRAAERYLYEDIGITRNTLDKLKLILQDKS